MSERSPQRRGPGAIFAAPAVIAVASIIGLASGLLGDGTWDMVAWLGLGVAIAAPAWLLYQSRGRGS